MVELPSTSWSFSNPVPGTWTFQVSSTSTLDVSRYPFAQAAGDIPAGYVIAWNEAQLSYVFSYLSIFCLISFLIS